MRQVLILFIPFLLAACERTAPTEAYLERDEPPRRSDTLVMVVDRMIDRILEHRLTGDRDVDITRELIEHHLATIEINEILLRDTDDEVIRRFAEELTETRRRELEEMREFLRTHPPVPEGGRRGMPDVLQDLGGFQPTDDLEVAYVRLMDMHLRDGIAKSERLLHTGQHDEIDTQVKRMIEEAKAALRKLERIKTSVGGEG